MDPLVSFNAFTFNPFQENTYLLWDSSHNAVIIDPGCSTQGEEQALLNFIKSHQLKIKAVWLTHGHIDHIMGLGFCQIAFKCPSYLHPADEFLIHHAPETARLYGVPFQDIQSPELFASNIPWNPFDFEVELVHIPGHSPGSVGFYIKPHSLLFSGDVLMHESVGRSDLPGGSWDTLQSSIKTVLYAMPDVTRILPGHGPETSIGWEKQHNPFVHATS